MGAFRLPGSLRLRVFGAAVVVLLSGLSPACALAQGAPLDNVIPLRGDALGPRFDGIGVVDGGGATSVLLKDYPEPQRSQILDLLYKPDFGASVSALLVEIPGDGNSTQGSMPSHMHTRDDLNDHRGYTWWVLGQAKTRNPHLTVAGMAWSAPGWVGNGNYWSQDMANYYLKWLQGLRDVYGLHLDSLGMRNEKGVNFSFAKTLRTTLQQNGFADLKLQGFDNWTPDKLDFVQAMLHDPDKRDAVDILSAHTLVTTPPNHGDQLRDWSAQLHKPVWNSEEHVYKKGFEDEISIVEDLNLNYIRYGATLVVDWYGIAALYPTEAYSETPAALLARSPWSGNYSVREALWGYAHYGQFTQPGWHYLAHGYGELSGGGTFVTLKSPGADYSIILETKGARASQQMRFTLAAGLSNKQLSVWQSDEKEQFVRQPDIKPVKGAFTVTLAPNTIYSLTTTSGQQKGSFPDIPAPALFPFPYSETFDEYTAPEDYGYLPHYTADISESFEIARCPEREGHCLRQVVPIPPLSWAPEWQPYTILGDDQWRDYEVAADVYLNPGDTAGLMGRVNDVGSGYGTDPKGYLLTIGDDGLCRLIAVRGKKNTEALVGDAEQQALIQARRDKSPGGEAVLAEVRLSKVGPRQWHTLRLQFQGSSITGLLDGKPVLHATDTLYHHGMAALMAGKEAAKLSTPYFDNLVIKRAGEPDPPASSAPAGPRPIYSKLGAVHQP